MNPESEGYSTFGEDVTVCFEYAPLHTVAVPNVEYTQVVVTPQSYLVYIRNYDGKAEMTFAHRGGYYVMPTECFGSEDFLPLLLRQLLHR